jgi:hypothetical protein
MSHFAILEALLFLVFLGALTRAPDGTWPIGRLRRPATPSNEERTLKEALSRLRDKQEGGELAAVKIALVEALAADQSKSFDYFSKKMFAAIDYAIKRHDWYEEQRSKLFQAALTIMTGVLTVIALIVRAGNSLDANSRLALDYLGAITLVAVLRIVALYHAELDRDRPYRLISDIRFWYFRYNLPSRSVRGVNKDNAEALAQEVARERSRFFDRAIANTSLSDSIREDFEQLFILHTLQPAGCHRCVCALVKAHDADRAAIFARGRRAVCWERRRS